MPPVGSSSRLLTPMPNHAAIRLRATSRTATASSSSTPTTSRRATGYAQAQSPTSSTRPAKRKRRSAAESQLRRFCRPRTTTQASFDCSLPHIAHPFTINIHGASSPVNTAPANSPRRPVNPPAPPPTGCARRSSTSLPRALKAAASPTSTPARAPSASRPSAAGRRTSTSPRMQSLRSNHCARTSAI